MSAELVDLLRTLAEVLKGPRVLLGLLDQASEGSRVVQQQQQQILTHRSLKGRFPLVLQVHG